MRISSTSLLKGATWTAIAYGAGLLLRLGSTIVLTRLLSPDLFGIMAIVYSVRTGIELVFSDAGLGTNIIYNKDGDKPEFYNTAWSVQLIRGFGVWGVCLAITLPLAHFYEMPILLHVLPVVALSFVVLGFGSMGFSLLQKQMQVARIGAFDFIAHFVSVITTITIAYASPTIWALVAGALAYPITRSIVSYYLVPGLRHRFYISKEYAGQIFHYGKWIFLASIVFFFSSSFDRLYLAKMIPLEILGVYAIARTLAEISTNLSDRLTNLVVFPLLASCRDISRSELQKQFSPVRLKSLLIVALGISLASATADLVIEILYDQRYAAAGWMLPFLFIGTWFYILSNLNKATLFAIGKSQYSAISDAIKLVYVVVFVTLGFSKGGVAAVVVVMATVDLCRYGAILYGQVRERLSFGLQDLSATLVLFGLTALWEFLRWSFGFGTSFDGLPIAGFK